MKKIIVSFLLVTAFLVASSTALLARSHPFPDVTEYWATDSIEWAYHQGIVVGDAQGRFLPLHQLSEAEFITMLCRMAKIEVQEQKAGEHWSQRYYDALKQYELPLNGYEDSTSGNRDKMIIMNRGAVARIVAAKNGFNLNEQAAIYYMYENDLSTGLYTHVKSFESYGADHNLTRDQAVTFLHRIFNSGYTTFSKPQHTSL